MWSEGCYFCRIALDFFDSIAVRYIYIYGFVDRSKVVYDVWFRGLCFWDTYRLQIKLTGGFALGDDGLDVGVVDHLHVWLASRSVVFKELGHAPEEETSQTAKCLPKIIRKPLHNLLNPLEQLSNPASKPQQPTNCYELVPEGKTG